MELIRLNRTTFFPEEIIEGWDSLVWNERYRTPGEFKLVSPMVLEFKRDLLPEGSLVTLRDSPEVMMVETHRITRDEDGHPQIEITGRTLDLLLNFRYIWGFPDQGLYKMYNQYSPGNAAMVLLWNFLINDTNVDISGSLGAYNFYPESWIPNAVVTKSTEFLGPNHKRWVKTGPIADPIYKFLSRMNLGLRCIRPGYNNEVTTVFSVNTSTNKGVLINTTRTTPTELRFDVYRGINRTRLQTANSPVVFRHDSGDLTNVENLFSIKNHLTTVTSGTSTYYLRKVYRGEYKNEPRPTGIDMREKRIRLDDPGEEETTGDFVDEMIDSARAELRAGRRVTLFSGNVSPTASFVYGRDYNLGDRVTVMAEFGPQEDLFVSEFTRAEDVEGERNWPTLEYMEEEPTE